MATASAVPVGNPGGINQANPALQNNPLAGSTTASAAPIPGGSTPSPNNPFMIRPESASGAATSGTVPSGSSVPPGTNPPLPSNFTYSDPSVLPGQDPGQQALLGKQFIDIAGKGVGGQLSQQYTGMAGTDSAIFQQWLQGQQPGWAQQRNQLENTLGNAGVSTNSTVAALGLADLGAQQQAQAGAMNAQLMQQNQQNQLGILSQMEGAAEQEVASSGWDVFGQVMGDIGNVAGTAVGAAMGMPGGLGNLTKNLGGLFGGGKSSIPSSNPMGESFSSTSD